MVADLVQMGLWPVFFEGAFSWLNDALDVAVAVVMVLLVGWHWALLPSLVAEVVPGLNLFPTWTAAIAYVMRFGSSSGADIVPATPEGSVTSAASGESLARVDDGRSDPSQ